MRLDRVFINDQWFQLYSNNVVKHLPGTGSDHRPLLVRSWNDHHKGIKYCLFFVDQPSFMNLVEQVWSTHITWRLQQKLKLLSKKLSQWSRDNVGNDFDHVKLWETKMQDLEEHDTFTNNDQSREALNKGQAKYIWWLGMQNSILKQKAKIKWFEEGDSNPKYLHSVIRDRKSRLQLNRIKDHRDQWVQGDDKIGKVVIHRFQQLFNLKHNFNGQGIFNYTSKCITEEENIILTAIPEWEEIREAVVSMSTSSSAGSGWF